MTVCCALRRQSLLAVAAFLLSASTAVAQSSSITIAWDANPEPDVAGYLVSWGTREGVYSSNANVGKTTQWTLTGADANQRYYFIVQAYNAAGIFSSPSTPVSNDGIIIRTGGTLPGQHPSVFWQHQETGELLTWHLNEWSVVDTRQISINRVADTDWKIGGTGDLNADGFTDLVWRHKTEGWVAVWYLQYNTVVATLYLSINRVADPKWRIRGVGDVNGDRHADLVWHHTDGSLAVWLMRGNAVIGTHYLSIPRVADTKWQIAAVGDMNGDGLADLIWQSTDGWLAYWGLRGASVTHTLFFSISRMTDLNWKIQAVIDEDGSGMAKLIWRRLTDGQLGVWHMRGANVLFTTVTKPDSVADADWKIVGAR